MSGSLSEQTADVSGDYSAADDVTHLNCKIQHTHAHQHVSASGKQAHLHV